MQPLFPSLNSHFSQVNISTLLFYFLSCCIPSLGKRACGTTPATPLQTNQASSTPAPPQIVSSHRKQAIKQTPCHHHLFMLVSPMLCWAGLTKIKMALSMLLLPCHQERISWKKQRSPAPSLERNKYPCPCHKCRYHLNCANTYEYGQLAKPDCGR